MKIYLAGKVDAKDGAWRDALLGKIYSAEVRREVPRWELVRSLESDLSRHAVPPDWPTSPNTHVLGLHEYVGPYRVTYPRDVSRGNSDRGYFHGTTWVGCHGLMDEADQDQVVGECLDAIDRADMVFAYISSPDCFGTLAELGYARARGKYVHLLIEDGAEWDHDDFWFLARLANHCVSGWRWHRVKPDCDVDFGGGPCGQLHRTNEDDFIRDRFRDAIVQWSGRPSPRRELSALSLVQNHQDAKPSRHVLQPYLESFYQIYRWTSDPRVRDEAARMVKRIGEAVGA